LKFIKIRTDLGTNWSGKLVEKYTKLEKSRGKNIENSVQKQRIKLRLTIKLQNWGINWIKE
jgi:hypothetical protein